MLVADGNPTDVPLSNVHSGVASRKSKRLMLILGELNGLKSWITDIGNACQESFTKKRWV